MLRNHTSYHPALDNEYGMVLLQDIYHCFHIHIGRNCRKSRFHKVADKKEVCLVQSLLLNCLHDHRFRNTSYRNSPFNYRVAVRYYSFQKFRPHG